MMKIKPRPVFDIHDKSPTLDSSDSEDDSLSENIIPVPSNFRVVKDVHKLDHESNLFVLDTDGTEPPSISETTVEDVTTDKMNEDATHSNSVPDKNLQELLGKAVCGPAFEKNYAETAKILGKRALKKLRQKELEKTKGKDWFDMPATELTEEAKRDLELLQMRSAIDPLTRYKRNDRTVLPKYFQTGRIVDAPEDYYSSRMTKKERKRTMVDELLHDMDFQKKSKERYQAIQDRNAKKRRGAFQNSGPRRKKHTAVRQTRKISQ